MTKQPLAALDDGLPGKPPRGVQTSHYGPLGVILGGRMGAFVLGAGLVVLAAVLIWAFA